MSDVIVIGAGPGGTAAATRAAQLGAQVTLIERAELGGKCINRNCIPLTGMLASVELLARIRQAEELGISVGMPALDIAKMVARTQQIIHELREGLAGLLPTFGIEIVQGQARLVGPRTVEVNGRQLEAGRAVILATGARWATPPDGIGEILWPDQALALSQVPDRLLIWGGGPVEVEFATLYAHLGSQVTLVVDGPYPLPDEDYEVGQRLQRILEAQGVEVITGARLKSAVKAGEELRAIVVTPRGETELAVEQVLWAGRLPNVEGLGLEDVGVKLDQERGGAVVVDQLQQTSLPGLYAVGDLTGEPFYSSVATVEGMAAAENALGRARRINRSLIPRHAFTLPEVACIGLSEEQAEEAGYEVEVVNIAQDTNVRALGLSETEGGVKIVASKKQGKVLGVHIVGHRATELIAEAAMAIQLEALAEDLAWAIRSHPTLSESLVEAGRGVIGQALYLPQF
jgi:dihydrolipoamide dehydrogenase